jgi:hypothetical protein
MQLVHKNQSDTNIFIRHGEITDTNFKVQINFLRDLNNVMGLLSEKQHAERFEKISQDTLDQICELHNIRRESINAEFAKDKRYKVQSSSYSIQIMVVCGLYLNHQLQEPRVQTGLISSYKIDQEFEFPLRICDLTPNTHLGFSIYDLGKPMEESLLASTSIDVFDYMTRMRMGTYNLYLHPKTHLDMSIECLTPGLFE